MTYLTTMMQCDGCAHQWVAVHPVEAEYLFCPVCSYRTPALAPPGPDVPGGLPRCGVCGWCHSLDDVCYEPEDFCGEEGEEWKGGKG